MLTRCSAARLGLGPGSVYLYFFRGIAMATLDQVREIIAEVLQLGSKANDLDADTPLLGSVPEFDSMAVVSVITAIEEQFGLIIEDDEVSADIFETLGVLSAFVEEKLAA